MQGRFTSEPEQTQSLTQEAHETAYATSETEPTNESQSKVRSEAKPASPEEKSPHTLEQAIKPTPFSVLEQHSARPLHFPDATKVLIAQEEANRVLGEIGDVLKNVNRALVSIQHSQPQVSLAHARWIRLGCAIITLCFILTIHKILNEDLGFLRSD